MKYLAAYLLLNLAGNEQPSAEDIKSVLSSVGVDAEGDRLEKLISELSGKNIQEVRIYPTICNFFNLCAILTPSAADLRGFRQARLRSLWWCRCRRCWWCPRRRCFRRGRPRRGEGRGEGGVRRRHGLRSLRLSVSPRLLKKIGAEGCICFWEQSGAWEKVSTLQPEKARHHSECFIAARTPNGEHDISSMTIIFHFLFACEIRARDVICPTFTINCSTTLASLTNIQCETPRIASRCPSAANRIQLEMMVIKVLRKFTVTTAVATDQVT
jgi:hypothetical protein